MASQVPATMRRRAPLQRMPMDPLLMVQRDMDRLFGNLVRSFVNGDGSEGELALAPRIDVREADGAIEIDAELPGAAEQDVDVSLDGDALVIAGEIRREHHEDQGGYRLTERQVGRFRRAIQLPFEPDAEKVEAQFRNGLLTVRIAQPPQQDRVKRIALKSGKPAGSSSPKENATASSEQARQTADA